MARGVLLNVDGELCEACGPRGDVRVFAAGIGMEVVHVDDRARSELDSRHGETLHRQAVGRAFAARLPWDPAELVEREARQEAETVAHLQGGPLRRHVDSHRLRARVRPALVRMVDLRAQTRMVVGEVELVQRRLPPVEILLRQHYVVVVQQRADQRDVLLWVHLGDLLRESRDVVGERGEFSGWFLGGSGVGVRWHLLLLSSVVAAGGQGEEPGDKQTEVDDVGCPMRHS